MCANFCNASTVSVKRHNHMKRIDVPVETNPAIIAICRWQPPGEQTVSDEWGGEGEKNMTNAWHYSPINHKHRYLFQLQTYVHLTPL